MERWIYIQTKPSAGFDDFGRKLVRTLEHRGDVLCVDPSLIRCWLAQLYNSAVSRSPTRNQTIQILLTPRLRPLLRLVKPEPPQLLPPQLYKPRATRSSVSKLRLLNCNNYNQFKKTLLPRKSLHQPNRPLLPPPIK